MQRFLGVWASPMSRIRDFSGFQWNPPPGLDDERVWPPPALADAWIRQGKGLGKERGIDVWIGKGPGKDTGKGNAWNNEVLLGHV